jgi:hypothetical protein
LLAEKLFLATLQPSHWQPIIELVMAIVAHDSCVQSLTICKNRRPYD